MSKKQPVRKKGKGDVESKRPSVSRNRRGVLNQFSSAKTGTLIGGLLTDEQGWSVPLTSVFGSTGRLKMVGKELLRRPFADESKQQARSLAEFGDPRTLSQMEREDWWLANV